jgi:hypothetical protein
MLVVMANKSPKSGKSARPPRIRVPNNEKALFTVDDKKFVGVLRRLSLTGGSAVLSSGPVPEGTMAEMDLGTVFGKVTAQIQFMHSGADGMPMAQAFRFIDMDDVSAKRFSAAAKKMERAGFSDAEEKGTPLGNLASQTFSKLRNSIGNLSGRIVPGTANKS